MIVVAHWRSLFDLCSNSISVSEREPLNRIGQELEERMFSSTNRKCSLTSISVLFVFAFVNPKCVFLDATLPSLSLFICFWIVRSDYFLGNLDVVGLVFISV